MNSTQQLSSNTNEKTQRNGGENKIKENKPDEGGFNAKENRKKELKSQGYNLSRTCSFCEKSYEGNDIVITKHLNDGSVNYYAIPHECSDCTKRFAKDSRQTRRREIICFFADDNYDPKCAICGDTDYNKLELDHIAGDGKKRKIRTKR